MKQLVELLVDYRLYLFNQIYSDLVAPIALHASNLSAVVFKPATRVALLKR